MFKDYVKSADVAGISIDKTHVGNFANHYISLIENGHLLSEEDKEQVVGFLEFVLIPKYTVGMANKHKARNLINKYQ